MVKVGRSLKDHLAPAPMCGSKVILRYHYKFLPGFTHQSRCVQQGYNQAYRESSRTEQFFIQSHNSYNTWRICPFFCPTLLRASLAVNMTFLMS